MVTKSAEDRHRCDGTPVLDGAMDRSIFAKRPMSPQLVIINGISRQDAAEVRFAQDNHMVDALASDRSDQPFCEAVLPRRARGDGLVTNAHRRLTSMPRPDPDRGAGIAGPQPKGMPL